jgi:hypothetical protein
MATHYSSASGRIYIRLAAWTLAACLVYAFVGPYSCRGARVDESVLVEIRAKDLHYYYSHYMHGLRTSGAPSCFQAKALEEYVARTRPAAVDKVLTHFIIYDHSGGRPDGDAILAVSKETVASRVLLLRVSGKQEWVDPGSFSPPGLSYGTDPMNMQTSDPKSDR